MDASWLLDGLKFIELFAGAAMSLIGLCKALTKK